VRETFVTWFGADRVATLKPEMVGEDFNEYGRTKAKIPICLFRLGAVDPAKVAESQRTGIPLPSLHSSRFAPMTEPTLKTGVAAMTAVALEILRPSPHSGG